MNEDQIIFLVVAMILNIVIIYFIIQSATRSVRKQNLGEAQTRLLMMMALNQGVNDKAVEVINNYFKILDTPAFEKMKEMAKN